MISAVSTVVCPLDGGSAAERAIPSALDCGELFNASVVFFSAVEDRHLLGRQRSYLSTLVERSIATAAPSIEVVVDPHAPRAVAELAHDETALVVMATSSRPMLHHGYVGSIAERVARESVNGALLVGPRGDTRLRDVERVVVPCDGSALSEQALTLGDQWANALDLKPWVVTCLPAARRGTSHRLTGAEHNYVHALAEEHGAQWEVLHGQDPGRALAHWATRSLITMTTHGHSGLSRLALGSVTAGTTRWATGPVFVTTAKSAMASSTEQAIAVC